MPVSSTTFNCATNTGERDGTHGENFFQLISCWTLRSSQPALFKGSFASFVLTDDVPWVGTVSKNSSINYGRWKNLTASNCLKLVPYGLGDTG